MESVPDDDTSDVICPTCKNEFIRPLPITDADLNLCYHCGTLFNDNVHKIIHQLEGPRDLWGKEGESWQKYFDSYMKGEHDESWNCLCGSENRFHECCGLRL